MATLKELKIRLGSVSSSEKITGAMKMISSAKVHKNEQALRRLLPFKQQIRGIMDHILSAGVEFTSPLIEEREVKSVGLVVYGSDDGLCGAYNLNIFKHLVEEIQRLRDLYGKDLRVVVYPVGRKIARPCAHIAGEGHIEVRIPEGVDSKMEGERVNDFTHSLREAFLAGELDLVEVVYMKFHSIARQKLAVERLFPVKADKEDPSEEEELSGRGKNAKGKGKKSRQEQENLLYIFEPDPNSIFNEVLPMMTLSTMQEITIENRASEQAARVMAMQTANDNAQKLRDELQLEYNKLRQQSITAELLDLLGGQVER